MSGSEQFRAAAELQGSAPSIFAYWLALLSLSACASVRTHYVESVVAIREARDNIVASGRLSSVSEQLLRMQDISEEDAVSGKAEINPDALVLEPELKRHYLHCELALARALRGSTDDDSMTNLLASARYALEGMSMPECRTPLSVLCDNLKIFYASALIGILDYLQAQNWEKGAQAFESPKEGGYMLELKGGPGLEDPKDYESIRPSAEIGIKGLENKHVRYGMGLALTACRAKTDDPQDRFLPVNGTCVPITAVLQFPGAAGDRRSAELKFYNAIRRETISVNGADLPLAANFTAPFGSLIERTGATKLQGFLSAFDTSGKLLEKEGFYSTEPYDAGKIPLITVHGLFSNPFTWISLQNDLMGDDLIRKHYQIWHYLYPTNLPILESAKTFRMELDDLEGHLHRATGSSPEGMVIIAHSMGGLLTKTAVAEDSSPMQELLVNPAAAEKLDPEVRSRLNEYLIFQRKPYISRVTFIAVPHRGSRIADNWLGRLGRRLLSLPQSVAQNIAVLVTEAEDVLRPEVANALNENDLTSVRGLSPENPAIAALAKVAVAKGVPFHSIIGNRGLGDRIPSSDGVVDYTSSHLEDAQSELIVPAKHSAHTHPLAIEEIRRILHLHVAELHR